MRPKINLIMRQYTWYYHIFNANLISFESWISDSQTPLSSHILCMMFYFDFPCPPSQLFWIWVVIATCIWTSRIEEIMYLIYIFCIGICLPLTVWSYKCIFVPLKKCIFVRLFLCIATMIQLWVRYNISHSLFLLYGIYVGFSHDEIKE